MNSTQRFDRGSDPVFDTLSERRRRTVFRLVALDDERFTVTGLARAVSAAERDRGVDDSTSLLQREVALHHVHLPKLDDVGLVEYDPAERVVGPVEESGGVVERATELLPPFDQTDEQASPGPRCRDD